VIRSLAHALEECALGFFDIWKDERASGALLQDCLEPVEVIEVGRSKEDELGRIRFRSPPKSRIPAPSTPGRLICWRRLPDAISSLTIP
jgi:hypothetical protein